MSRATLTRRSFAASGLAAGLAGAGLSGCGRGGPEAGVLRVGLAGAPDSLDPFRAEFAAAAILLNQVHAPLEGYRPGLGLAESWTAERGARAWRCTLREGLVWSDGAPLTAEDVVWSVRHGVGPRSTYPAIGDLLPLRGAPEAALGTGALEDVGVRAEGARTVLFELGEPLGVFPETMREFYPVPRHALERHGNDWTRPGNFVGAGPYLPAAVGQTALSLTANPSYFGADTVAVPRIEAAAVEDAGARLRMFRAGDLDLAQDPPRSALGQLGGAAREALRAWPAPRLTYVKINHARAPLSDPRVRRALNLAADRAFMAQALLHGYASAAQGVIPGSPNRIAGTMEARREEARALIAEAGAGGAALELLHSGGEREGLAVALADDWGRIGVETRIVSTEATGLYAAVDEGRFDLALSRFDRGLKDAPWRFLEPFAPGGFAANFGWTEPALARALEAIRAEPDAERRTAMAHEAERLILDAAAIVPLAHEQAAWMIAPRVTAPGDGPPLFWSRLSLDG